jgi:hypothetical protein
MRSKLLITTAVACFALSMGMAVAQGPGGQGAKPESGAGTPGSAGSMSQSAPGGASGSGMSQGSPGSGAEKRGSAGSAQMAPPSGDKSGQGAQPQGQSPSTAQSTRGDKDQRNQAQSPSTTQHNQSSQAQPADRGANPRGTNEQAQSKEQVQQGGQRNQATDSARGGAAGSASTSAAAGGSNVTLNTEQKTKIRETVINSSSAPRATNVNISLSVGTTVPTSVRIAPVPSVLVEINPGWRSYEYFVVNDEIIIVDPRTHRIVAILPV